MCILCSKIFRNDKVTGERKVGTIHHHIVDGPVQQLRCDIRIHYQMVGVDLSGNLPDLRFPGRIFFRYFIFKDQTRSGKGLSPAPFIGNVPDGIVGVILTFTDQPADHRERDQHGERKDAHQHDLQDQGIAGFHDKESEMSLEDARIRPCVWQGKRFLFYIFTCMYGI